MADSYMMFLVVVEVVLSSTLGVHHCVLSREDSVTYGKRCTTVG